MIYNFHTKPGYTLVELMIIIVIVGVLVSFGASAYSSARDRQAGVAASEQIVSLLQENQKKANIGDKDCVGKLIGQQLSMVSASNTITSQSICEGGNFGTPLITSLSSITFDNNYLITFNPLTLGASVSPDPLLLDFTSINNTKYRIKISSSGTIEYQGVVVP